MEDGCIWCPDTAFMAGVKNKQGITTGQISIQTKTVVSSSKPDTKLFPKLPIMIWKEKLQDTQQIGITNGFHLWFSRHFGGPRRCRPNL